MEKYKVLVVDDEFEVRQGIIDCVDWENHGFIVVCDASNGIDALDLAETTMLDLVIADIKMPFMDGLDLAKSIKLISPTTKIIFITGFDSFEYMKKAINLNVIDYIVKPINLEEFIEVLKNTKQKLDDEKLQRENIEFLKEHYYKSIPILRENFLIGIIEGRFFNYEARKQAKIYDICLDSNFFMVSCIKTISKKFDEDVQIFNFKLKNITQNILQQNLTSYITTYMDYIVVLTCFEKQFLYNTVLNLMNELSQTIIKQFKISVPVGVGYIVSEPELLHKSLRGAIAAIDYKAIIDTEKPIYITDIEPDLKVRLKLDEKNEIMLLSAIRQNEGEQLKIVLTKLLDIDKNLKVSYQSYKSYLIEIVNAITSLFTSFEIELADVFGSNFSLEEYIYELKSKSETLDWFYNICNKVSNIINNERLKSSEKIIVMAKKYAHANFYLDDFSVEDMCGELCVSSSYFSSLFKRDVGITFINYLTNIRMSEAKKLLLETTFKTYVIAEKVGYVDANYFSFAFKKHFGISPTQLRSGKNEKN